jgi:hypothetical protein
LALAALVLALAFLAGHPQTFVYVTLLALAYFAFRARQAGWSGATIVMLAAGLILLTTALAAVQLIPSLHFILHSTRTSVPFAQAGHGFPFEDVLQFFVTGFVSYWQPLYVGLLPLGLAAFGLTRPAPQVRFWAFAALTGLVLSFGTKAAAYDAAYWLVPGLGLFRGQEHLALVVSFSLAVLAAFGMDALCGPLSRGARRTLQRLRRAGSALWVAAFGLLGLAMLLAQLGLDQAAWQQLPGRVGVLVFGLGLALLALALRAYVPAVRRWTPAVMAAVVVLDLFAANRPTNRVAAYTPYAYDPMLEPILSDSGFFRVQDDFRLAGHAGCAYHYRAVEGVTPYKIASYARFMEHTPEVVRWELLGVRYVVTWRGDLRDPAGNVVAAEAVSHGTVPDERGNVTRVFRLSSEARRAFLTHRVHVAADDDAVSAALAAPDFDPLSIAVLPEPLPVEAAAHEDRLEILADVAGRVRLRAETDAAAALIVSESHFPGWRVTVDGEPASVLRADGALLAVYLPPGAHEVEFAYRPASLGWGAVCSSLALALALVLILRRSRTSRA